MKKPIPVQAWQSGSIPMDETPIRFDRILARAKVMKQVLQRLLTAAALDSPVLLMGEPGTGKDLVARSVHLRSRRRSGPFVSLNVRAVPRDLVTTELFGHAQVRADGTGLGKLAQAKGGSFFLEGVDSMDLDAQAALLRALAQGQYTPLGSQRAQPLDLRLIAASLSDLGALVRRGLFLPALLERLGGFTLSLPPLRQRSGGVPMLAQEFLREVNLAYGLKVTGISVSALEHLETYAWPGNVREFKTVIQRAVLLARSGKIEETHLPGRLLRMTVPDEVPEIRLPAGHRLAELEQQYIQATLRYCGGNKSRTAKLLGISRKTLYEKLALKH
jgi:DNA-binding NtrC family response regulator